MGGLDHIKVVKGKDTLLEASDGIQFDARSG